jgi:hypothetical protein
MLWAPIAKKKKTPCNVIPLHINMCLTNFSYQTKITAAKIAPNFVSFENEMTTNEGGKLAYELWH